MNSRPPMQAVRASRFILRHLHSTSGWIATRWILSALGVLFSLSLTAYAQVVPTNGLTFWVKADAGVGTNGSSVTNWADQSTSGFDVSQGIAGQQPTLIPNAINGLPVVRFDASQTNYLESATAIGNVMPKTNYTTFAVWRASNIADAGGAIYTEDSIYGDGANGYVGVILRSNVVGQSVSLYNWDNNADAATVTNLSFGTPYVFSGWQMDGALYARINNGPVQTAPSDGLASYSLPLFVGGGGDLNSSFQGDIAEILIYDRPLSPVERQDVVEYFYARYSIPEPSAAMLLIFAAGILGRRIRRA